MIIDKNEWSKCKICNKSIDEITREHKRLGAYKSQYFKEHIWNDHNISLNEYFNNNLKCPCGICGKILDITTKGSNIVYKKMSCGRNEGVLKWSEKAREERKGSGNPMFNKKPWNAGLTKENCPSLLKVSEKMSNRKVSIKTRKKQSESAKKRKVHGHTGYKHSDDTKKRLRQNTLSMIKNGKFKQTDTKPSIAFESYLNELQIKYEKEKILLHWSFDFYLTELDVYIEIDGDYFHSNPILYSNGPKTKTQKVNWYRDKKKNEFCSKNNIVLIRFWESEIFGDEECIKQKLLQLKK